jgi:hypothetical protein
MFLLLRNTLSIDCGDSKDKATGLFSSFQRPCIYDLTPELKNLVQVLSTTIGTSNSQTVEYLCRFALNQMEEFNPDTTPTRSMNFERDLVMLDIPEQFLY